MANDTIYEKLREAIADGALQPHTRLVEADLMERYAASRPAVRTALLRLEHEGLVEQRKNSSARVRFVDAAEAVEIYRARSLLEGHAAGLAATRISDAQLAELDLLVEQAESASSGDAVTYETRFHQTILDIAGDGTIRRLCASLHGHLLRYHHYTRMVQDWSARSPCEHRQIADALRARDADAATAAMRHHLDRLTAILEQALAQPDR